MSSAECVVERVFDAPVAVIWQMWTEPEYFKRWYGPQGFSVPVAEMDVRVGGRHLFCMASSDGQMKMWSTGAYTVVVPRERLVYTDSPCDENGVLVSPESMGMPAGYPAVTEVQVVLEAVGDGTKMVLTHVGVPAGAANGWSQAFDKLADCI